MFPNSRAHRPPTIAGSNSGKSAPGPGAGARTPAPVIVLECVLSWFALLSVAWPVAAGVPTRLDCMFEYCHPGRDHLDLGDDMLTALASGAGNPAVAGVLGLGAAGLAGVVVAMAWSVHARQIRVAEQLARRQFMVTTDADMTGSANGNGHRAEEARGANGAGAAVPVIIEGPDTVVTGEQARYRVRRSGDRKVVSWAAGGGSVAQSPDPTHPEELLLIADQPGDLMVSVRVREGMAERRVTKPVTAVADVTTPTPPFTLRLFLHAWGLVAVSVLIVGFAGALDALGSITSADFIALVVPLAALLGVVAVARGSGDGTSRPGTARKKSTP